jgi:phosphatidylserine decarboxylase
MNLLQSRALFRVYPLLPHGWLNRGFAALMRARRPRMLVQAAIRAWIRRARIDMADFEEEPFATVEEFFLRRLRPGARPLQEGLISPVDGRLLATGTITPDGRLLVKGQHLSAARLVHGRHHDLPIAPFMGGQYAVIFLSPRGYHRIHMPLSGTITRVQWIPGRFFPQNERALRHLHAVYERNERAVLQVHTPAGADLLLVLVGASLVGGIHLSFLPRPSWVGRAPVTCQFALDKGQELGHFSFGSTVVMLLPPNFPCGPLPAPGADLRMGQQIASLLPGV